MYVYMYVYIYICMHTLITYAEANYESHINTRLELTENITRKRRYNRYLLT